MTTKLSISSYDNGEAIGPKDQVRFRIKTNLSDIEEKSSIIRFRAPALMPLITFVDATYTTNNVTIQNYDQNSEFRIKSYKVTSIPGDSSNSRLTLLLSTQPTGQLSSTYLITASAGSNLNGANGQNLRRMKPLNGKTNKNYIDLKVPNGLISPASGTVNPSSNSIKLKIDSTNYTQYTLTVDNDIMSSRANRTNIKDIVIFAYTKTTDVAGVTEQKYLLKESNLNTTIQEDVPPTYSIVESMVGVSGAIVKIERGSNVNNNLVDIYVAVARYKNTDSVWSGEWLQKDSNGNAIWKKMAGAK